MADGIVGENYRGQRITAEEFKRGWQVSFVLKGRPVQYPGFPSAKAALKFAHQQIDRSLSDHKPSPATSIFGGR